MHDIRCAVCGERLRVEESVRLVLRGRSVHSGSLIDLGEQAQAPGCAVLHTVCYEQFEPYVSLTRGAWRTADVLVRPDAVLSSRDHDVVNGR